MKHNGKYVAIIVAIAIIACVVLYNNDVRFAVAIVAVGVAYGLRLVWKYGRIYWEKRHSQVAHRERFILLLVSLMVLFLFTGTALFLWAFSCEKNHTGDTQHLFINAEYLLRSLVCSFQLFTGNIDSNVLDEISDHEYIKGLISVQAILSFLCTIAVILSLAFAKVMAYYKLHRQTSIDNSHNHLYVFFGMNEPSRILAKSIHDNDDKHIIVFVENNIIGKEGQDGWDSIIGMFTHKRQTFAEAENLGARVTFTDTRLCDIDKGKLEDADILTEINLRRLRWLMTDLTKCDSDSQLHVFFLSDNEDENIRALATLATDTTINTIKTNNVLQRFYCHARQNGLNRIVEDIAVKRGLEVRIIDSSHLAVELLKANENYHPVNLVDVSKDNPTTVSSEFNSLIVGFDEVGQDAMKFLYEFGAFVDYSSNPENEHRSVFHCIATDKRMDELEGFFSAFAPAAFEKKNRDNTKLLELKKCDCKSGSFFKDVLTKELCEKLNYVVIAVGDDELGMTLAIRILNYIRREREDLRRLRIFVRSYHSDKETLLQKIANHYNEGYNKDSKEEYQIEAIIIPFGQMNKIYSYSMIVDEELTAKGREFQKCYARLKGESLLWDMRRAKELNKGSLNSLRSLRRKESQDLANALHADTKIHLLKSALGDGYDWKAFFIRYFDDDNMPQVEGQYNKIDYKYLADTEKKAILNLARLEHIRWNASHEMLGYTQAPADLHSCNERTRQHNCLRPWHDLDKESIIVTEKEGWKCDYKAYDFGVVDITLLLNKEKLLAL